MRAFSEWRKNKLESRDNFDPIIYETDLERCDSLTKANLCYSLCCFIPEITKLKDGSLYPGCTLYQMIIAIQRYLSENGLNWKLIEGCEFSSVKTVLDNVMKERARDNIGTVKRQANVVTYDYEEMLWKKDILGEQNPDQLRQTVMFLIGINCGLRAGDEHQDLRRDGIDKPSQFSFQRNCKGVHCLVYTEDTVTKTNDGGLASMKKDRKVRWIFPHENTNCCPVRLVDKYMSLCPPVTKATMKSNFYLRSLEKPNPAQWYSTQVLGLNKIRKTVKEMLKDTELDGFFSNHSLRRTGTSHLFQAGVDRKLVKEYSGHRSDALDQYQITSEDQKQMVSNVLAGKSNDNCEKITVGPQKVVECEANSEQSKAQTSNAISCSCNKKLVKLEETNQVASLINDIVSS